MWLSSVTWALCGWMWTCQLSWQANVIPAAAQNLSIIEMCGRHRSDPDWQQPGSSRPGWYVLFIILSLLSPPNWATAYSQTVSLLEEISERWPLDRPLRERIVLIRLTQCLITHQTWSQHPHIFIILLYCLAKNVFWFSVITLRQKTDLVTLYFKVQYSLLTNH